MPRKRQGNVYTGMLQLQVGGRREISSVQPPGCSHAKNEIHKRRHRDSYQDYNGKGVIFYYTTPGVSFIATLRNNTE
jgi:hypothetical protein